MNQKIKFTAMLGLFITMLGGAALLYDSLSAQYVPSTPMQTRQTPDSTKKSKAPDFSILDDEGKYVTLSSFQGNPLVINFGASWCPPCRDEMPEFDKISRESAGNIAFLMVNMTDGTRETVDKAKSYATGQGYTFPIYYDTLLEAAHAYGVTALPTTVFVDQDGYIADRVHGKIDEMALRNYIAKLAPKTQ